MTGAVLTCCAGTNADIFPRILGMYVKHGALVADTTYGKGVFWRAVDESLYRLSKSDLADGTDALKLPHTDSSFDALVFDPPYLNGGKGAKESINKCYKNPGHNSYEAVLRLYLAAALEAYRVLRRDGVWIVKCQPGVADHVQRPVHVHLISTLPLIGMRFEDEFVLHASATPVMRHVTQKHARKNHSYFLVFRKVR